MDVQRVGRRYCVRRHALRAITACLASVVLVAPSASAQTWGEAGDAGELPLSAQVPTGFGALTRIVGTIPVTSDNDVDMYRLCVPNGLSALAYDIVDPQLFMFSATGLGLAANDDIVRGIDRRSLLFYDAVQPGVHYLAIARWNREPASTTGEIFPDVAEGVNGPTGPGGEHPVSDWVNAGDAANEDGPDNYVIDLYGAQFCLTFAGFFPPIRNDVVNNVRAGRTIPIKWKLATGDGTPVSDTNSVVSLSSQLGGGSCKQPSSGTAAALTGQAGLRHQGNGNWRFNWKTQKSYAGDCRTVAITLSDGTTYSASFYFR